MSPITNNLIENSDYKVLKESMPQKEHRYGHRYFTNQHGKHKVVSSESNVWQISLRKNPVKVKIVRVLGHQISPRKNPVKVKIVRVLGHFTLREIPVSRTINEGRSSTHLSKVIMRVASTSDIRKAPVAESVYALFSLPNALHFCVFSWPFFVPSRKRCAFASHFTVKTKYRHLKRGKSFWLQPKKLREQGR